MTALMHPLLTGTLSEDDLLQLLKLLADGAFQPGESLARRMGISNDAVSGVMGCFQAVGIQVETLDNNVYRLTQPVDLLDRTKILAAVSEQVGLLIERLDVPFSVDSTNSYVAQLNPVPVGKMQVCLAEIQYSGRGRRGHSWVAPFGAGLCISFGWSFRETPATFSALGLAVAIALVSTLRRFGVTDVGIKWPNDLLWQRRKLAGILIEMSAQAAGDAHVVIGIGINVCLPTSARSAVALRGVPVSDLTEILQRHTPTRNELAGALIDEIAQMLRMFSDRGFAPFFERWRDLDMLANSQIVVHSTAEVVFGIARGVAHDGTLLVEVDGRMRRFASGDVSIRSSE